MPIDAGAILQGAGVVVAVVGVTRIMLGNAVKNIKEHCKDQRDECSRRMECIEKTQNDEWSALHSHGHKGLDGNGSKVTR